jgi:hypothetical protein
LQDKDLSSLLFACSSTDIAVTSRLSYYQLRNQMHHEQFNVVLDSDSLTQSLFVQVSKLHYSGVIRVGDYLHIKEDS